jgi:hypothetical protein
MTDSISSPMLSKSRLVELDEKNRVDHFENINMAFIAIISLKTLLLGSCSVNGT